MVDKARVDARNTTKRVALTPETMEEFRDFSRGIGLSQDETIAAMMQFLRMPGESAFEAGRRLRSELHRIKGT